MLLERIKLKNLLSFGPEGIDLELRKLNVLIGPNGSGKSNLIEAISLLQAMPRDLTVPIVEGGGILDWLWRGEKAAVASIETLTFNLKRGTLIKHQLSLGEFAQRMAVFNERIEEVIGVPGNYPTPGPMKPALFYNLTNVKVSANGAKHEVPSSETDPRQSILSQRQDPVGSYEITWLGRLYRQIAIYREWILGPESPARRPQKTDLLPNHLEPNCRNLALVINRLRSNGAAKHKLMECMRELIDGFVDCQVDILGGTALLLVDEGKFNVPANRLSDGTLRYLSLLAVLLDPEPPQLVCIDEPELGLHPDLIVKVGELLVEASERMQLIVTTHSSVLVDALNRRAEDIVVCQRGENGTQMRRLEKREMDKWLEKYSLSELWSSGQIGGNRW